MRSLTLITARTAKSIIAAIATLFMIARGMSAKNLLVFNVIRLLHAKYVMEHIAMNVRGLDSVLNAISLSVMIVSLSIAPIVRNGSVKTATLLVFVICAINELAMIHVDRC